MKQPEVIEIRVLGPLQIQSAGRSVPLPRAKKARLLLGYLIVRQGQWTPRSQIAAMLWPDSDPTIARFNLRQLLFTLRKELGDLGGRLRSSGIEGLEFDAADCWVDVSEFNQKVGTDPRSASELYRGRLLEGIESDLLDSERLSLEHAYLGAIERIARSSDGQESIGWLKKLIQIDPYRESAQQMLIACLAESGDISGAKKAFSQFESLLYRELRSEPTAETMRIFRDAVSRSSRNNLPTQLSSFVGQGKGAETDGSVTRRGASSSNLPRELTSFIGREREIQETQDLLRTNALVTLTGAGGYGKTRLALRVASGVVEEYPDGVWLVELAGCRDERLMLQAVADALRIRDQRIGSIADAVAGFLSNRKLLLILDNCEHLLSACREAVNSLLRACPRLTVLATSREALGIGGEQIYPVPSLGLPPRQKKLRMATSVEHGSANAAEEDDAWRDRLLNCDAARLFVERAALVSSSFDPAAATESVIDICDQLDGIPLAIELAAVQIRTLSAHEISDRLARSRHFLQNKDRSAPSRHLTLRSLFEWSFDLLNPDEKALFSRLCVFHGGWTLEAAEAICGDESASGPKRSQVLNLITALVDKSLVIANTARSQTRYRMAETVREYAAERLADQSFAESMREAHCAFFLELVVRQGFETDTSRSRDLYVTTVPEMDNIRAAIAYAVKNDENADRALTFAGGLFETWDTLWLTHEGQAVAKAAIEKAGNRMDPAVGFALLTDAQMACRTVDSQAAQGSVDLAHEIFQSHGDDIGLEQSLWLMGTLCMGDGDLENAIHHFERGLDVSKRQGRDARTTRFSAALAMCNKSAGDLDRAQLFARRLTESARSSGIGDILVAIHHVLGAIDVRYARSGDASRRARTPTQDSSVGYDFTTIEDPGIPSIFAYGIRDLLLVGDFRDSRWKLHGFVLDGNTFSHFDAPVDGAWSTHIHQANRAGAFVGHYTSDNNHGFLQDSHGFKTIEPPGAISSGLHAINDRGEAVGLFSDARGQYGYSWNDGALNTMVVPGSHVTFANGIDNSGSVSGGYWDSDWNQHGFIRDSSGRYETIDLPGAIWTILWQSNNSGERILTFWDSDWNDRTGVFSDGTFTEINVPGAYWTNLHGIDDDGVICGTYGDAQGSHSYLARPSTSRSTTATGRIE